MASNMRLKQLLGELKEQKDRAAEQALAPSGENELTLAELNRKVETSLMRVLEERFNDEAFTAAISEQSALSSTDKVRVEFEGDEAFWSLRDNYTFEMLLHDAARYWDISPSDGVLNDERGAIWPNDAYVALELQRHSSACIQLKLKPLANRLEEESELFGADDEEERAGDDELDMYDFMRTAEAAEDTLLIAQLKGLPSELTNVKKLKREMYYFIAFVVLFIYVLYSRRTVRDAYQLQQSISTVFTEENFGAYNEKVFLDIATPEEMFEWMYGPLLDGLYPLTLYNGLPVPDELKGYVMIYNKVIGKIRLRQLRVREGEGCALLATTGVTDSSRTDLYVDSCYPSYSFDARSNASYGPAYLQVPGTGFTYSSAEENKLSDDIMGEVATYDGSGFVRDLDNRNRTAYLQALGELRSNLWVDRQTRAVIVSLNLYNGNYNYYCVSQYLLEYSAGGTIIPSATNNVISRDIFTSEYFQYPDLVSKAIPEAITYACALLFLGGFLRRLYRARRVTGTFRVVLRDMWSLLDIIFISVLLVTIGLRLNYYAMEERQNFDPFLEDYQEMSKIASAYSLTFVLESSTVFICVVKSLKFFSLQKDLKLLQMTLGQAVKDLLVFVAMTVILFVGFVVMGLNIFGMQAPSYSTIVNTLGTLFLILLGEFDYAEMNAVSRLWAIIFFIIFVLFMFFVVLNIFLAILNDAYTVVHTQHIWEELERRKPSSLLEKFEIRRNMWRERRNMARINKLKHEKAKEEKRKKEEQKHKDKEEKRKNPSQSMKRLRFAS